MELDSGETGALSALVVRESLHPAEWQALICLCEREPQTIPELARHALARHALREALRREGLLDESAPAQPQAAELARVLRALLFAMQGEGIEQPASEMADARGALLRSGE